MSQTKTARSWPYPGGKSVLAPWIIGHFPAHECYIEPFGGSASVLVEKERSRVEIVNDLDDMLVRVYRVLKSRPRELHERLEEIPFSRHHHERWMGHLDSGEWPTDDVEAAARWFYLRYSQHSAKLTGSSGFKTSKKTNPARAFANAVDALPALADRLDGVIIESMHWRDVVDKYDGPETLAYLDPPYVDAGDELYRHSGAFDHSELVDALERAEGKWIISYEKLPESLEEDRYHVREYDTTYSGSARDGDECKDATERLVMNFNPDAPMEGDTAPEQTTLRFDERTASTEDAANHD